MSEKYYKYWGKARKKKSGEYDYHLLVYHCLDVAAVGWEILKPESKRNQSISHYLQLRPDTIQDIFVLSLLLHDIGKFSETFQSLIENLFIKLFEGKQKRIYEERHDTLGFLLWRDKIFDLFKDQTPFIATVLNLIFKSAAGHHGIPPKQSAKGGSAIITANTFFTKDDIDAAVDFSHECFKLFSENTESVQADKQLKSKLKYISWQFAGLAVFADWIGSDTTFFNYPVVNNKAMPLAKYWQEYASPNAKLAIENLHWKDKKICSFTGISTLFPFIKVPSSLQRIVSECEIDSGPQLWLIEDVTGSGKTEAALTLAQRIMKNGDADGLYIGLPTMATANAMYERMQSAYEKIFESYEKPSLVLAHGKRHLSEKFVNTVNCKAQAVGQNYGDEENASAYCNSWIADNRKKALLADIGVGTIDQAVMAILPARHQSLRMTGLYRKILIIDEVHAYDAYVEHLLGVLLEAHARNGGSAILLSATIPEKIRKKLSDSFKAGINSEGIEIKSHRNKFPLITRISKSGERCWDDFENKEERKKTNISFSSEIDEIYRKIITESNSGSCVCWIRNTVNDAKKAYLALIHRGVASKDISLFHSRFAMADRTRIENEALHLFGKNSGKKQREGRILISTQVVEQSLDLDFDFMVTDLAPIDLLIQRAGRIQRHRRNLKGDILFDKEATDERGNAEILIFAPKFAECPDNSWTGSEFKGTNAVYKHSGRLWLTQKVLLDKQQANGCWAMPDDARELIEYVYSKKAQDSIPPGLDCSSMRACGQEQASIGMGHLNALVLKKGYCRDAVRVDQWNEEDKIQTRLTQENQEIALAIYRNGSILPYANVKQYAWDWSMLNISKSDWQHAGYLAPSDYNDAVLELKKNVPRLKYTEIVFVNKRSSEINDNNDYICKYYSPAFGWGKVIEEEV
ncbi:MAG: CRISPR-associated helicase Cas3' [Chitinivibrionales bacterium]|nr:CRISPR-associated helicase Cas3' [Chitinivibrionales bacterium]